MIKIIDERSKNKKPIEFKDLNVGEFFEIKMIGYENDYRICMKTDETGCHNFTTNSRHAFNEDFPVEKTLEVELRIKSETNHPASCEIQSETLMNETRKALKILADVSLGSKE